MLRLFAAFLLVLLPLQFSWAAVAVYCGHESGHESGHETGPAQAHFGHHVHEHAHAKGAAEAAAAAAAQDAHGADGVDVAQGGAPDGDTLPGATHLDCGQCHGTAGAVLAAAAALPGLPQAQPPVAAPDAAATPGLPAQPERPQWARLA